MSSAISRAPTGIADNDGATRISHLILDRDGVLLEEEDDGGFLSDPGQLRWVPGALEALAAFHSRGLRVTVATNQSGIGRGVMTQEQLAAVHARLLEEAAAAGGRIDSVLTCPHAPDAGCDCRKPAPGLILSALRDGGSPASNTLVVGDDLRDLDAARAAGVPAVLVRTGKGKRTESRLDRPDVPVFDDLRTLAHHLVT